MPKATPEIWEDGAEPAPFSFSTRSLAGSGMPRAGNFALLCILFSNVGHP